MVVVLPDPFGPMKPYTSPGSSLSDSRSTANSSPYFFVRSRHSITGAALRLVLRPEGVGQHSPGQRPGFAVVFVVQAEGLGQVCRTPSGCQITRHVYPGRCPGLCCPT